MSVKNVAGTVKQPSLRGAEVSAALVVFGARVVGSVVAAGADVTAGVDRSEARVVVVVVLPVSLLPSAQATRASAKAAATKRRPLWLM
jgi:F420-0:gamma-glutamyl ligase